MARTPRIGIQAIYNLSEGKEQLKPLVQAMAKEYSIGGGTNLTINGSEVQEVTLTGAEISIDSLGTANITIPTAVQEVSIVAGAMQASISGDTLYLLTADSTPKASANFELSPSAVTLSAGIAQTITASRLGDGVIDYWSNSGASITRLNDTEFKVVGKKRGNHKVGFYVNETEQYYGASKNVDFNVSSGGPLVLMHFDDDTDWAKNEGSVALTTQGTVNATLEGGYFGQGAYCSVKGTSAVQAGFYGMELGGDDFTVEFFCTSKYNTVATVGSMVYIDVPEAEQTGTHFYLGGSVQNSTQYKRASVQFGTYTDEGSEGITYIDGLLDILKTGWRHFAFVYQHDLRKATVYVGGVKVFEREITCLSQNCLMYWYQTCIDELRITPAAIYTQDFEPPAEPFE